MLKNWILHALAALGAYIAYDFGILAIMWSQDITYISSFLIGCYVYLSGMIIYQTHIGARINDAVWEKLWLYSTLFLNIGMIGTIIGFLVAVGVAFSGLVVGDTESMTEVIKYLAVGISTALWTTLVGLIGSTLMQLQISNIIMESESEKF